VKKHLFHFQGGVEFLGVNNTLLFTYLLTYNLASLSGPNKCPGQSLIDVKSDEAI
jgi:hypothetical protein